MDSLSPRLATLALHIDQGSVVADIGTDHAFLPIYLVNQGICSHAIGGDINPGPYQVAKQTVKEHNLNHKIAIRQGDGLQVITPREVDTVVMAGMGGTTMIDILAQSPENTKYVRKLILQPMIASDILRVWLADNGWQITDEELVREDRRIYEIIVAQPGVEEISDLMKLIFGPRLLEKKPPLLKEHLNRLLKSNEQINIGLRQSIQADLLSKKQIITNRIEYLKQVIACL